ncbi:hypothetical protein BDU57DRAFT_157110 [Ampelomyces quisqualis]|uniref:Zn(2)-C6 fungal-type domain-containing protein n=1 Tax=Ampelomyces quisqualis TaxID=50730 RepID=A0A6A5QW82_AMPQU|nr:hypothetical protein BDU57DRAFT_157110 [Ampelomyces quisqualis]
MSMASLPAGEGPSRFSPTAVTDWQPRRKSVSNACERCRRRKIRCDGETPCATCKRFTLQCIRKQKPREVVASEHREALEGRIHHLEAQLAAHVNAPMHGMESLDQAIMATTPTSFDWQTSPLHLNLDTTVPASFTADDLDLGSFSTGGSLPSISINECEHVPNVASPSSDVPSLHSGTTRASSPDTMPPTSAPPHYASMAHHLFSSNKSLASSPMEPHTAPSWEFMAQASAAGHLKPHTESSKGHSRRTSATSLSASSDENAMSPIPEIEDDLLPFAPAPRLPRQGIFAANPTDSPTAASSRSSFTDRSRALATTPLPSRFEAETLTSEFAAYIESLPYRAYTMTPPLFAQLCESVYPTIQPASASNVSVSVSMSHSMARFHVFLSMAVAMKLRIRDAPEHTNALLDTCYELAMRQAGAATFWAEQGGVEAAQLVAVFAAVRKVDGEAVRPLQQSFSW